MAEHIKPVSLAELRQAYANGELEEMHILEDLEKGDVTLLKGLGTRGAIDVLTDISAAANARELVSNRQKARSHEVARSLVALVTAAGSQSEHTRSFEWQAPFLSIIVACGFEKDDIAAKVRDRFHMIPLPLKKVFNDAAVALEVPPPFPEHVQ